MDLREGAPQILSISVMGVRSEVLLHSLEERGIYVSAGSACSSHKRKPSATLAAMGMSKDQIESTVRLSFCEENTIVRGGLLPSGYGRTGSHAEKIFKKVKDTKRRTFMIFHAFLIKYAEIAIKGKNRYLFEDALVKQMRLALEPVEGDFRVIKEQGRVYVLCPEEYDFDEAVEALQRVFGIVGISPVVIYEDQGFEQMGKDVVSYMKARYPEFSGTFKVYTRRARKSYPINSMEVSASLGGLILDAFPEASVDVHNPQLTLSVEIREKIYVYSETIPGPGGMPVGTNGKAMLLLSGGIDSPVAAT